MRCGDRQEAEQSVGLVKADVAAPLVVHLEVEPLVEDELLGVLGRQVAVKRDMALAAPLARLAELW